MREDDMIAQSKYEKLAEYLARLDEDKVNLTFADIEDILGEPLPDAANKRAWWANSTTNNHAVNGWMNSGWETANVNMKARSLDFIKQDLNMVQSPMLRQDQQTYFQRSRSNRSNLSSSRLNQLVQRIGGVDILEQYMTVVERYLFGEISEMELGQELRRLFHRRP
jgi:hypothetical protein